MSLRMFLWEIHCPVMSRKPLTLGKCLLQTADVKNVPCMVVLNKWGHIAPHIVTEDRPNCC